MSNGAHDSIVRIRIGADKEKKIKISYRSIMICTNLIQEHVVLINYKVIPVILEN